MLGLIDLQDPPAIAPFTIWLLRYWDRHSDQITLFASYDAGLAQLAAGVRGSWGNVRFEEGVPRTPDGLDDAAAVAIYFGQVPDGQPLTSGDRGEEGFNLYAETVAGAAEEATEHEHPFTDDETETVGLSGRPALRLPLQLTLDGDNVTLREIAGQPDHPAVSLVLFTDYLDDELVLELTEQLCAVPELRHAAVTVDRHGNLRIPVRAPDVVADDVVSWTITDTLAVEHADRDDAYFSGSKGNPRQVALTVDQTQRLVEALVSLACWRFWLQGRFATAATAARRALSRASHADPRPAVEPVTVGR